MQTWTTMDKTGWGDGPWQNEPDKMSWTDEVTKMSCLIVRNHMGSLCGYVGVSPTHPWYEVSPFDGRVTAIAHGGLNYGAKCDTEMDECESICHIPESSEEDDIWWFGFDCSHGWDAVPASDALLAPLGITPPKPDFRHYRTIEYVQKNVISLAAQLFKVDEKGPL